MNCVERLQKDILRYSWVAELRMFTDQVRNDSWPFKMRQTMNEHNLSSCTPYKELFTQN